MTHSITPQLKAHFASETTTLCTLWKITRADGVIFAFTDFTQDITYNGVTYLAATAFTASTVQQNSDFSVDNLEVDGVLDSSTITEADLLAGLYDFADLLVLIVNYNDLTMGDLVLKSGSLGQVTIQKRQFVAEVRGISQLLQQNLGHVYAASCDALLGDARCTLNLAPFTFPGSVTAGVSNQSFFSSSLTQGANYFNGGLVIWTAGLNVGLKMEVKDFINNQVTLALAMPYSVAVGDTFNIVAGCDKAVATCKSKFNNLVNFRGFPSVPGTNALLSTAGTIQPIG